jgi:chitinase
MTGEHRTVTQEPITRRRFLAASLGLVLMPLPGDTLRRAGLPRRIVAGYWPAFLDDVIRVVDLPLEYNLVYLFAAVPEGAAGTVVWRPPGNGRGAATHLVADIAYARYVQKRSVVLSVGGAGAGISFSSRVESDRFVRSIRDVITALGGVDGVDLNTFEADAVPRSAEYAWIARQLKAEYGPRFAVTAPPAPWNQRDQQFCAEMVAAGLLDLCSPQYYDGPDLAVQDYVVGNIGEWVRLVGPDRLCVGFGVDPSTPDRYMTPDRCASTWRAVDAAHAGLRGAFAWNVATDESTGWGFAGRVGALVAPSPR